MPQIVDPSELEGDDLANWYLRSPADVEAEREAARQDQYNSFVRSIGSASGYQDDSAVQGQGSVLAPAQAAADDAPGSDTPSSDGDAGWIEAKYFRPMGAMAIPPPPSGPMVGPTLDARGLQPLGPSPSSFFGQHAYNSALGGYFTDLPKPLNIVTSTPAGWWDIGDGRRVQAAEVERIYGEQKRRLNGQDTAEPTAPVRAVDRWQDGQIPTESQVQPGERELDPTCAPNGGWERDPNFHNLPVESQRYQAQITHAPGLDYVIRNPGQGRVKFDGCDVWDPQHPLLEAKGPGYASLLPKAKQWGFLGKMLEKTASQAERQAMAAPDQQIEWHYAEPEAYKFFNDATMMNSPPIVLRQTAPH